MNEFTMRVAIADDHPALLIGVRHELQKNPVIELSGEAHDSTELVRLLDDQPVDVAVIDYSMPDGEFGDGAALFSYLRRRYPKLRIVVLTVMRNSSVIRSLLANGINCILSKSDAISHLVAGIHAAYANGRYFSPTIESIVNALDVRRMSTQTIRSLTAREIEVVRLYSSGLTINEIASKLHRSKQTISAQKMSAMRKLGIERDADLIKYPIDPYQNMSDAEFAELGPIIAPVG